MILCGLIFLAITRSSGRVKKCVQRELQREPENRESSSNLKPTDHLCKPLQHLCPHPFHKLDAPDNEMPAAVYAGAFEFCGMFMRTPRDRITVKSGPYPRVTTGSSCP